MVPLLTRLLTAIAVTFILVTPLWAEMPYLPPVGTCPLVDVSPHVDGVLSDPVWQKACLLTPFVLTGTGQLANQQTTVRVCRDNTALYLAFDCAEDQLGQIRTAAKQPDKGDVWEDDEVEVFLAPDDAEKYGYYHILANAEGVCDDESWGPNATNRDMRWNSLGLIVTGRNDHGWTCEMALPFAALNAMPRPDGSWRISVNRAEQPRRETSSWAPLESGFHEPRRFGVLRFAAGPVVTNINLPIPFIGKNPFGLDLLAEQEGIVAALQAIRGSQGSTKAQAGIRGTQARGEYELSDEGDGYVRLVVQDQPTRALLYATPCVPFSIAPAQRLVQSTLAKLNDIREHVQGFANPEAAQQVTADYARLSATLAALAAELSSAKAQGKASPELWAGVAARADALAGPVSTLESKVETFSALDRGDALPGYGIAIESAIRKVRRDDTELTPGRAIHLSAAKRERESAQVVVVPFTNLKSVAVSWTDLVGPNNAVLAKDNVKVWQVGYVKTRPPAYKVGYVGWYPDPLMPLEPFDATQGKVQPLWITVYAPPGAAPGDYKGTITIQPAGQPAAKVSLTLTVWDFELPLRGRLKTAFSTLFSLDIPKWYGFPDGKPSPEFRRKYEDLLLEHRLNPMALYEGATWPPREDFDYCLERGLNSINLKCLQDPSEADLAYLKDWANYLRGRGLLDMAYVYGYDEAGPDRYDEVAHAWAKIRQAIPDLRRCSTIAPNEKLRGTIDIWVPLTAGYSFPTAEEYRRRGDEVWWYICCGPQHPYQNWFIDYPATDARGLFWATWKYRVTGFLYYEMAMWRTNWIAGPTGDDSQQPPDDPAIIEAIRAGKRWPDVPWNTWTFSRFNGDGLLVYPGRNQTPLPSLRLEVVRDGVEDYEMLGVLAGEVAKLEAWDTKHDYRFLIAEAKQILTVNPAVVRDTTHYTSDPQIILAEREKVAREIMRIRRVVGGK